MRNEGRENIFWIKHKYILLRGINSTQKYTKQNKYKLFMWKTSLGEQEMNGGVGSNEWKKENTVKITLNYFSQITILSWSY